MFQAIHRLFRIAVLASERSAEAPPLTAHRHSAAARLTLRVLTTFSALAFAVSLHAADIVGGSALLSATDAEQLQTWLGAESLTLTKIFSRVPGDGKTSQDFHAAADIRGRTITVIELPAQGTYQRKVIGGYNPQSWTSIQNYNYTGPDEQRTAFLFNLTTGTLFRQKLNAVDGGSYGQYQTYNVASYGPTFGGGHDIHVNGNLSSGYSNQYSYGPNGFGNHIPGGGQSSFNTGAMEVFGVSVVSKPEVRTIQPSAITSTSATLNALVTANLRATEVVFEYSTDPTFSTGVTTALPAQSIAGDAFGVVASKTLTGLSPQATYYFRAVATNSLGTAKGVVLSFLATDDSIGYRFSDHYAGVGSVSGYTLGSQFNTREACTLTHLGVFDHNRDGLVANMPVGVWTASGVLLASTTVQGNDPLYGSFRYRKLATPVVLAANTRYFVGAYYPANDYYCYSTSDFSADERIQFVGAAYNYSSGFGFPNYYQSNDSNFKGYFGANFLLAPAVTAPFAYAGPDQESVQEGALVTLDGTASKDTNNPAKAITLKWEQVSGPSVDATFNGANTATPTFTAPSVPASGCALVFRLTVDNGIRTATDTVTVNVVNVNNPPTANAGTDQAVGESTLVSLDGSLSSDLDGDSLTLQWKQISGPSVLIDGTDATKPIFMAPSVTAAQGTVELKFELVANDGYVTSGPSTVSVHVKNTNDAPTAVAGPNQSVDEQVVVTFDGTQSSDPDNDTLTYSWTQVLGTPVVTLAGSNTATPTFKAPVVGNDVGSTTLTFELVVSDGKVSSTSQVNVRVVTVNNAPLANAGDDQTIPSNTPVVLDGSTSADTDGDELEFTWVQTGGPQVALSGTDTPVVRFTSPVAGPSGLLLTFELTVDDGYGGIHVDETVVNVTYVNHPPTANAETQQTADEGSAVTLVATASDPDENPLTITWTQISGTDVQLVNPNTLSPSFTAPSVTRAGGSVVFRLTVNDGYGGTASSDVTVGITNLNRPPVAQAPANESVLEGSEVSLIGQGSDPDIEEQSDLTYSWERISGPVVVLNGTGANVSFTAPLVTAGGDPSAKETLVFRLTVKDPNGSKATDEMDVVVSNVDHSPIAVAGGSLNANEGASVTLNGSASSDPDGDNLTYSWEQVDTGFPVELHDANTEHPYFTAPFTASQGATLKFKLTVEDGFGGTSSDTATVAIKDINTPPSVGSAQPSVGTLWAPDHRMVPVSILSVIDPENNASITITGVTQDEPTNGLGDGDTATDALISTDAKSVLLRAERSGKGDGRVYWVKFVAWDFEGSSEGKVKVVVPKSKKTDAALDSGAIFDSTN